MVPNEEVLNSWKEVAAYLGRGVRTVQRWEQELGLPVRRPRGKSRSAVIAFKPELDKWLHQAPIEHLQQGPVENLLPTLVQRVQSKTAQSEYQNKLHTTTESLINKTHMLLVRSTDLCEQLRSLREQVEHTIMLTAANINRNSRSYGVVIVASPTGEKITATLTAKSPRHAVAS